MQLHAFPFRPAAALLMAAAYRAVAAETAFPAVPWSELPDPAAVRAVAVGLDTNRYPDADDILVEDLVRESYQPDGTGSAFDDEYVKVFTEKGRRRNITRSLHFSIPYDTVTVVRAELFKPDGRTVPVDVERYSRIMTETGQMSANIYDPNSKLLQFSLPGLEIGDLIHIVTVRRTKKSRVPGTWADLAQLEYTSPIRSFTYEVVEPAGRPLRHKVLRDPVTSTVQYTRAAAPGGGVRHRWQVRNVPQVFEEPNMPPMHTVAQRLLLSTSENWPAISRWYWELSRPHLDAVTPEMREVVRTLSESAASREERIRRIFTWVSQNVRYMGITTETEAPGYEPHDVSVTFGNRYGVCRDKAALLAAMFRLAGLDAYPVLIQAGARMDPDVPVPFFNHAIVAVARPGGGYDLMDPTNENTRDLLPAYLCNRSYLVAHPTGETLALSPIVPAERNLLRIRSAGRADARGTLTLDTRLAFDGINDTVYRGHFAGLKADQRRLFFEGLVKARLAGAELIAFDLAPADLRDTTRPLEALLSVRVPDYPARGDGADSIVLPWLSGSVGYVNFLLGQTGLQQRRFPLETEIACGTEESLDLDLSQALGGPRSLPGDAAIDGAGLTYARAVASTNGRLSGRLTFRLERPEYPAADYPRLKQTLRDMEYAARQRPLFEAGGSTRPDMRVLSDRVDVRLDSPQAWTATRSWSRLILTYAGKKRNAEVHLNFNPAWETLEIVAAAVTNADGTVHRVRREEINTMDAAWVGQAPRYPAGRTLVVSLPGVETGSVVAVTTRRVRRASSPFFSAEYPFRGFDPIDRAELCVDAPADLPLRVFAPRSDADTVAHAERREAGRQVHTWSSGPRTALMTEDNLPPAWTYAPAVFVSAGDWPDFARRMRDAFDRAGRPRDRAEAFARELVRGAGSPVERIRRVRDAVLRGVRAAGPSFVELPLSITPPDATLADGYGHDADRAWLLTAMLRAAGFDAEPVLAGAASLDTGDLLLPLKESPQYGLFNTVLVAVRGPRRLCGLLGRPQLLPDLAAARPLFLGDGDQYDELGTCGLFRHPSLDLAGRLATVRVSPAMEPREVVSWRVEIDERGSAAIAATNWYFGPSCGETRRLYAEMPPEERRRHFLELAAGVSQSAEVVGDPVTLLDAYPVVRAFAVRADRYAVVERDALTVQVPDAAVQVSALRADSRKLPLFQGAAGLSEWTCRVILPASAARLVLAPQSVAWQLPCGLGDLSLAATSARLPDGRLEVLLRRNLRLEPGTVPPEIYPVMLEMNRRFQHPQMRTIVAERRAETR